MWSRPTERPTQTATRPLLANRDQGGNRNFKKLSDLHKKLFKAFDKIESLQGKRVFAMYFRDRFYGQI